MSSEVRGSMSGGQLKLTDEKVVFLHAKSGKKDSIKVGTLTSDWSYDWMHMWFNSVQQI